MIMQKKLFITGTDTEVGKTLFTCALIKALQDAGKSILAFKPVAAGCELINNQLKNEDALAIQETLTGSIEYQKVNPIALRQPIAPHIAANIEQLDLNVSLLQQKIDLKSLEHEFLLIEGAGGWLVPLNDKETFADYAVAESMQVILVVGLKLGCINHALLTQQNIAQQGLKLVGWVANHIDPDMQNHQQNIETLKQRLDCPMLAEIPYITHSSKIIEASKCVKLDELNAHEVP